MIVRSGFTLGGALVIGGALLPWLYLYAGLQQYKGTTGAFGWMLVFAGALLACVPARKPWHFMGAGIAAAMLAFTGWLIAGMFGVVHRPDAVMLVPRPGPGLFTAAAGEMLAIAAVFLSRYAVR